MTAYLGGGYNRRIDNWEIGPTASLQYSSTFLDSFDEEGSDAALSVDDQTIHSLRSLPGFLVSHIFAYDWSRLIPELRAK